MNKRDIWRAAMMTIVLITALALMYKSNGGSVLAGLITEKLSSYSIESRG